MENNNKQSGLPIAIIGLVALVAIGVGAWFYFGKKSIDPATNSNSKPSAGIPASAPQGASPAWSMGPATAPVTIEEFADFQCPTCAMMHPKVKELRSALGDKVRIVFRNFPLDMHRWGYDAACAVEAAGVQGKFWDMQNLIFTNQQSWSNSNDARSIFVGYAKTLGLNVEQFSNDMISLPIKNRVDADKARGRAIPITSTPTFFINNKQLGSLDALRSTVDKAIQDAGGATQNPATPATNGSGNSGNANSSNSGTDNSNK